MKECVVAILASPAPFILSTKPSGKGSNLGETSGNMTLLNVHVPVAASASATGASKYGIRSKVQANSFFRGKSSGPSYSCR